MKILHVIFDFFFIYLISLLFFLPRKISILTLQFPSRMNWPLYPSRHISFCTVFVMTSFESRGPSPTCFSFTKPPLLSLYIYTRTYTHTHSLQSREDTNTHIYTTTTMYQCIYISKYNYVWDFQWLLLHLEMNKDFL